MFKKFYLLIIISSLFLIFSSGSAYAQAGQLWQTVVGEPRNAEEDDGGSGGGGGGDIGPIPNCTEIDKKLKSTFNVVVRAGRVGWLSTARGYSPEAPSCAAKKTIYKTLGKAFQSNAFRRKYKIDSNDWAIECYKNGETFMRGTVNTFRFDGVQLSNCRYMSSHTYASHLLVHEMGHHFSGRTGGMSSRVPWVSLRSKDGGSCYNSSGFIKSYGTANSATGESFAEAIAHYVYNRSFTNVAIPITNFRTQCNATFKWFRTNVHNGFTY